MPAASGSSTAPWRPYLQGSLASGTYFRPKSDVNLLAVVEEPLPESGRRSLTLLSELAYQHRRVDTGPLSELPEDGLLSGLAAVDAPGGNLGSRCWPVDVVEQEESAGRLGHVRGGPLIAARVPVGHGRQSVRSPHAPGTDEPTGPARD